MKLDKASWNEQFEKDIKSGTEFVSTEDVEYWSYFVTTVLFFSFHDVPIVTLKEGNNIRVIKGSQDVIVEPSTQINIQWLTEEQKNIIREFNNESK